MAAFAAALLLGWVLGPDDAPVDLLSPAAAQNLRRWSLPSDAASADGLGGGISYAVDPALCASLLPHFPEESWLTTLALPMPQLIDCSSVRAAVRRALASWAAVNGNLRFYEVTDMCAGRWQTPTAATPAANASNGTAAAADGALCDGATASCATCDLAELVVGLYGADDAAAEAAADGHRTRLRVEARAPLVAAADWAPGDWPYSDFTRGGWIGGFPATAAAAGGTIVGARVELLLPAVALEPSSWGGGDGARCWALDPSVCDVLHSWESEAFDAAAVELVVDVIAYSLFALGILLATITTLVELYRIMQTAMLSWDTDGDGVVEVHEVRSAIAALCRRRLKRGRAAYLTSSTSSTAGAERTIDWRSAAWGVLDVVGRLEVAWWTLTFVLILLPLPMRAALVRPCYECDDLDVALAQAAGAALGLSRNRTAAAPHFRSSDGKPAGAAGYNCSHPLRGVAAVDGDAAAAAAFGGNGSTPTLLTRASRRALCAAAAADAAANATADCSSPRRACPSDDDADGLRALYPECVRATGCERGASYDATTAHLEAACAAPYGGDYTAEWAYNRSTTAGYDWQTGYGAAGDGSYAPPAGGRALPAASCLGYAEFGHTGLFRALLLGANYVVLPFVALLVLRLLAMCLLRLPCLKETRQRNKRLQRTAATRKAEIRRMNARGAELIIKQQARRTHVDASEAVQAFKLSAVRPPAEVNAADAGQRLKTKLAARKGKGAAAAAAGAAAADGSESGGAAADDSSSSASPALAAGGESTAATRAEARKAARKKWSAAGGDGAEAAPLSRPRASAPVAAGIGRVAPV